MSGGSALLREARVVSPTGDFPFLTDVYILRPPCIQVQVRGAPHAQVRVRGPPHAPRANSHAGAPPRLRLARSRHPLTPASKKVVAEAPQISKMITGFHETRNGASYSAEHVVNTAQSTGRSAWGRGAKFDFVRTPWSPASPAFHTNASELTFSHRHGVSW